MNKPQVSTMTTLWNAKTLTGERTQIAYVQSIPALKTAKEAITYNALDLPEEQQAKGSRKAETLTIPILYTENQHDKLTALANANEDSYWFIKLPETTASTPGSPSVFYFSGDCDLGLDAIEIDGILQENITIYRSSEVLESKGFPTGE